MNKEPFNITLPESSKSNPFFSYLFLITVPFGIFAAVLAAYFGLLADIRVEIHSVIMIGLIFFIALVVAPYNSYFTAKIFARDKDEFKAALKAHILKHLLSLGQEKRSSSSFKDFAASYLQGLKKDYYASIGASVFPMLGILGTFISIAISMPSFNSSDLEGLEGEISQLLTGVATAFYVSIYGIFLALWWLFFDRFGESKLTRIIAQQQAATANFFWTKDEIDQYYVKESLSHYEEMRYMFKAITDERFFKELDGAIARKFKAFGEILDTQEQAVKISSENVKRTLNELSFAQRDQHELSKVYAKILSAVSSLSNTIGETSLIFNQQFNKITSISDERVKGLEKSFTNLDLHLKTFYAAMERFTDKSLSMQEQLFERFCARFDDDLQNIRKEQSQLVSAEVLELIKEDIAKSSAEAKRVLESIAEEGLDAKE